jgi:hypothetical protein
VYLIAISKRSVVFADNVLAKAGALFDTEDTADGPSCGTYSSSDDGPDRTCRSVTRCRTLFGTPDRSLCMRRKWQAHDDEGRNCKGSNLHDCLLPVIARGL